MLSNNWTYITSTYFTYQGKPLFVQFVPRYQKLRPLRLQHCQGQQDSFSGRLHISVTSKRMQKCNAHVKNCDRCPETDSRCRNDYSGHSFYDSYTLAHHHFDFVFVFCFSFFFSFFTEKYIKEGHFFRYTRFSKALIAMIELTVQSYIVCNFYLAKP